MASGLAPKLPLTVGSIDGPYRLIQSHVELVRQNFKMLMLTNPGERMMNPDYGVGLKHYLFELNDGSTYADINQKIVEQTRQYMSFVQINKIDFGTPENSPELFPHSLSITIEFTIVPLQRSTTLRIEFDN
tara:strand:+ start:290 stop:682 length:393 start_codon:yes stop_codon:yes gene_type:complete